MPPTIVGNERLPRGTDEMRDAILSAVRSGRIEELRHAFELNEIKPDLGDNFRATGEKGVQSDPVAFWRRISGDGEGREVLAALGNILEMPAAVLPLGKDVENSKIYVWPYLAELPPGGLTPAQEVDLLRLVSAADAKAMKAAGKYAYWRLAIGAEGTWLSFTRK